ncbi:hypothetical protein T484DRAFT_2526874 [Baffinella frigidus]|nr:hypothetical protein T484DRAFT_2526874 [Cryptophyta sp. CCMP2293]
MGNSCDTCSSSALTDFEQACSMDGSFGGCSPSTIGGDHKTSLSFSSMKPEEVLHRLVTRPHLLDKFLHAQPYGPFDVDFQNEDGDTALHLACRMGIVQSCKLLMKGGGGNARWRQRMWGARDILEVLMRLCGMLKRLYAGN